MENVEEATGGNVEDLASENLNLPAENVEGELGLPQSSQFITAANSVQQVPIIITIQTSDGAIRSVNDAGKIEINLANISVII